VNKENLGSFVYFSFGGWRCFHKWIRVEIWIRGNCVNMG